MESMNTEKKPIDPELLDTEQPAEFNSLTVEGLIQQLRESAFIKSEVRNGNTGQVVKSTNWDGCISKVGELLSGYHIVTGEQLGDLWEACAEQFRIDFFGGLKQRLEEIKNPDARAVFRMLIEQNEKTPFPTPDKETYLKDKFGIELKP
jgi:hypothetical protein